MKILDDEGNRPLKRVSLFLTRDETISLLKQLEGLISKHRRHHVHVEDENFEREITIAIYTESNISKFDERSRRLIEKDE